MGLFGIGEALSPQVAAFKDIVAFYRHIRQERLRLNNMLVQRLSTDMLKDGAKRLGMLRGGTFVFDTEDDTSVLMDYCIYDVYSQGRNAIEQYLCDCPPDPDSDEAAILNAMQHATYALITVLRVEPGVGCHIRNLFTDETHLLVDMGFAETAQCGAVLAMRLLDFGDFVATSGAALPVGVLNDDQLHEFQREISERVDTDGDFDPAGLIQACLQSGASAHVRYEGLSTQGRIDVGERPALARTSVQERRVLAKQRTGKAVTNQRCRCGSGKMFKNCCAKR